MRGRMEQKIQTTPADNYYENIARGDMEFGELFAYIRENHSMWLNQNVLWDLSEANFNIEDYSYKSLRELLVNDLPVIESRKHCKTAIVTQSERVKGLFGVVKALVQTQNPNFGFEIFHSKSAAVKWLNK